MVTLVWVAVGVLGALPFYLSGVLPSFPDAVFESVSGFSTTGLTVIADVEAAGAPLLFWRALSHWLGGLGIVVITLAFLPFAGEAASRLFAAESPGPETDRISGRIANDAKALALIYVILSAAQAILLRLCGMGWFDAVCHALATVSTGGFSTKNAGIAAFHSPAAEWVIIIFMLLGGFSFTVLRRIARGKLREALGNSEARAYFIIIIVGTGIAALALGSVRGLREALFQVASTLSTTGFGTVNLAAWPAAAQGVVFILLLVGGCSSSTAGGVKVIRHLILWKQTGSEMRRLLAPRGVFAIMIDGKAAKNTLVYGAAGFVFLYLAVAFLSLGVLAAAGLGIFQALNLSLCCLGNVGLGLGAADYGRAAAALPAWAKWYLSALMIAGRLELWTVFALFSNEWRRS